jgi:hypothetical protein
MATMVKELREALLAAGVEPALAEAAAEAVAARDELGQLPTKADLKVELSQTKYDLIKWFAGIMTLQAVAIMTGAAALMALFLPKAGG